MGAATADLIVAFSRARSSHVVGMGWALALSEKVDPVL